MSASKMFEVDMGDIGVSMDMFAHKVGETTEQATVRYGVAAARGLATETQPKRSTAGSRKKKAAAQMRRVIEPMGARDFSKLSKSKNPRAKMDGQWVSVDRGRLIEGDRNVWRVIEANRQRGMTRKLKREDRFICKQSDFNKVATRRAKLIGAAKGAWLGAGKDISRMQEGMDRNTIGKNFLGWTQKHSSKGTGRKVGRGHDTTAQLTNNTTGAAKNSGLSVSGIKKAIFVARRSVFQYYAKRLKAMKIKGRGTK